MNTRTRASENFYLDEFQCSCCKFNDINPILVEKIQRVRDEFGPIKITSACRCEIWNEKVGGKKNSAHTKSHALDLECRSSRDRLKLLSALFKEFNRIGVSSDGFIHVDIDPDKAPNVCWTY